MNKKSKFFSFSEIAWNAWCIGSIVGIWPRFIEPQLLSVSKVTIPIENLPQAFEGLKILQLSDLHFHEKVSYSFLSRLHKKVKKLSPDLIVFTGDFLCYSHLKKPKLLQEFLSSFSAPFGCYAILGNHDYASYVSVNEQGEYDVIDSTTSALKKGWKKLFNPPPNLKKISTRRALETGLHMDLVNILNHSPFRLLHNLTALIPIRGTYLNICGLGEYTLGRFHPAEAFTQYDRSYPGIVLTHNPDSVNQLKNCPGELILCGHTHGGQVDVLGLSKKFMLAENAHFKRGLMRFHEKWLYINRGLGSVMKFRWFSSPEISLFTLKRL